MHSLFFLEGMHSFELFVFHSLSSMAKEWFWKISMKSIPSFRCRGNATGGFLDKPFLSSPTQGMDFLDSLDLPPLLFNS